MTNVKSEHFVFVSRYTCACGGPVMIVPHSATDLQALLVVQRHEKSPEHRYYRALLDGDTSYYDPPETPLEPSAVGPRPIGNASVGPDREPGLTIPGSRDSSAAPGRGLRNPPTWSLEDELWPGRTRS